MLGTISPAKQVSQFDKSPQKKPVKNGKKVPQTQPKEHPELTPI